jgi:hypothetical protein
MGGGFYGGLVRGAPGTLEVGFIGDIINAGAGFVDMVSGGPKKRERTAKAMRDAEIAKAEGAAAAERAAMLQLQAVQAQQQQAQQSGGGGFLTRKAGPMPVWGWAVAVVGVGGLAYWLLKDDGRGRGR